VPLLGVVPSVPPVVAAGAIREVGGVTLGSSLCNFPGYKMKESCLVVLLTCMIFSPIRGGL
jgi:hypothetical protein